MTFFDKQIILENHRVRLVPFSTEYEAKLSEIIFDEGVEFSVNCESDDDVRDYIEKTIKQREIHNGYPCIIRESLGIV